MDKSTSRLIAAVKRAEQKLAALALAAPKALLLAKEPDMAEELPLIAAAEWARNNASTGCDPVDFGHKVALVFLATQATQAAQHHAGNNEAIAFSPGEAAILGQLRSMVQGDDRAIRVEQLAPRQG